MIVQKDEKAMANNNVPIPFLPRPVLVRAVNEPLFRPAPEDDEALRAPPRLQRSTNSHEARLPEIFTPGPAPLYLPLPPRLTREDERRLVTDEELDEAAKRLF